MVKVAVWTYCVTALLAGGLAFAADNGGGGTGDVVCKACKYTTEWIGCRSVIVASCEAPSSGAGYKRCYTIPTKGSDVCINTDECTPRDGGGGTIIY